MPRGGAVTLSDVREPALVIVCELCERRGRYKVERLMAEHGDAKLTDLLTILADCPKARSMASTTDARRRTASGCRRKGFVTRSVASRIRNGGVAMWSAIASLFLGIVGWFATSFFAKPFLDFLTLGASCLKR
jgi:hypothetical protein